MEKRDTGFTDANCEKIYEGDKMRIRKHLDSRCCEHYAVCTVRFNESWQKFGLQDDADGEWLAADGIFSGFFKV